MMLSKENTTSLSNYLEDFKKYIVMVREDLSNLQNVVAEHSNLVYSLDIETRLKLADNIELIEVALIKHIYSYELIDPIAKVELEEILCTISNLVQTTSHDFFIVLAYKIKMLVDFVTNHI